MSEQGRMKHAFQSLWNNNNKRLLLAQKSFGTACLAIAVCPQTGPCRQEQGCSRPWEPGSRSSAARERGASRAWLQTALTHAQSYQCQCNGDLATTAPARGVPALPRQRINHCKLSGQSQSQKTPLSSLCLQCADRFLTSGVFYPAVFAVG